MATITINDVEYNTDDFNEEQTKMYNEILFAKEQEDRYRYTADVLKNRASNLADMIVKAADPKEEVDEKKT